MLNIRFLILKKNLKSSSWVMPTMTILAGIYLLLKPIILLHIPDAVGRLIGYFVLLFMWVIFYCWSTVLLLQAIVIAMHYYQICLLMKYETRLCCNLELLYYSVNMIMLIKFQVWKCCLHCNKYHLHISSIQEISVKLMSACL